MKLIISILILFICCQSFADDRDNAIKHIQKAILAYPQIKAMKRRAEKKIIQYLPIDKKTLGTVGGLALSVSRGYVDTKVIKRMNIHIIGGDLCPNLLYNFRNREAAGDLHINWSF